MQLRIISIGAPSSNPLWGEKPGAAVRTGHATTTLIQSGKKNILIDPGLPAPILAQRLGDRITLAEAGDERPRGGIGRKQIDASESFHQIPQPGAPGAETGIPESGRCPGWSCAGFRHAPRCGAASPGRV